MKHSPYVCHDYMAGPLVWSGLWQAGVCGFDRDDGVFAGKTLAQYPPLEPVTPSLPDYVRTSEPVQPFALVGLPPAYFAPEPYAVTGVASAPPDVPPIPLPAGVWLILTALAGLALIRRMT